ncbi:MAG: hypothetical protein WCX28_05270 [Bacteriovoracaceae bacterium]|nr:hypothetical protein [Bacteroidota bacterium]
MEFLKRLNVWQQRGMAALLGGVAGYAYYYYIGCVSGTCAITSNPYISTGYGILIGALLINSPKTKSQESDNGTDDTPTSQKI